MREHLLRQFFDADTCKVAFAVVTPLAAQALSPERILTILTLLGGALYAWLKLWRLYRGKEE
jgi:hypothetical protein